MTRRNRDATQAQPEPFDDPATLKEMQELFGKDGEPRRNRTYNPQIKRQQRVEASRSRPRKIKVGCPSRQPIPAPQGRVFWNRLHNVARLVSQFPGRNGRQGAAIVHRRYRSTFTSWQTFGPLADLPGSKDELLLQFRSSNIRRDSVVHRP